MTTEKKSLAISDTVIVALDFDTRQEAMSLVAQLGAACSSYKVGIQLLVATGPRTVDELVASGKRVFLDLKLHEIPNSVSGAVKAAGELGVSMVTVHASAGQTVLQAAVDAAAPYPQLKVLALTVITSLSDSDLPQVGINSSVRQQVARLTELAHVSGCHGVIASAQEASLVAGIMPKGSLIVTPGIQLVSADSTDQVRIASPRLAAQSGATHIVVGRAIARASNPGDAFAQVVADFEQCVP